MDVRKVGLWMAGIGALLQVNGFALDAISHSVDPNLAAREGVFSFANAGHLLAYLGVALVLAGVAAAIFGPRLYRPGGDHRPGLRAAQFFAPLAAILLVLSGGYVANASSLGGGHSHGTDTESAAGHTHTAGDDHSSAHDDDHGATADTAGTTAGDGHSHSGAAHQHGGSTGSTDATDTTDDTSGSAHDDDHGGDVQLASTGTGHTHSGSGHVHDPSTDGSTDDSGSGSGDGHNHDPGTGSTGHNHDPGTGTGTTTGTGSTGHSHDPGTGTGTGTGDGHNHDGGTGTGTGHAQCGAGHSHGSSTLQPLDQATQTQLDAQLGAARNYALQFPTAADAKKAGYVQVTHYYCGIGAHYLKIAWMDDVFDPAKPEILLYDGDGPDAKLVGINYYVRSIGHEPDGFVGPNDHWHQHIGLCLKVFFVIGPESWTDAQCKAAGGYKQPNSDQMWLLHAWVVPGYEHPTNIFSGSLPSLPPGPYDGEGISF